MESVKRFTWIALGTPCVNEKKTHGCGMARANNKITLPVLSKREEDSLLRRSMVCVVDWLSKFY